MELPLELTDAVAAHPYPLLFATVSGAHLYGFASADSDWDLRGVHVLPVDEVVGLGTPRETIEDSRIIAGREIDLVTHDARKFFELLLKRNGYVLEQLLSPLIVHATPEHMELKDIAQKCLTRHHCHHYLGFAATQWRLFEKEEPPRVKPLLYVYRVLLTGIHLMRTGEVEASLERLDQTFRIDGVGDLIALKRDGNERERLGGDVSHHRRHYEKLTCRLEEEGRKTRLPDAPAGREALNALLVRLRVKGLTIA